MLGSGRGDSQCVCRREAVGVVPCAERVRKLRGNKAAGRLKLLPTTRFCHLHKFD